MAEGDGPPSEAIEVCSECSVRPLLHKTPGLILAQSADNAGAAAELAIAHDLDPGDRDIEYALEQLRKRIPRSVRCVRSCKRDLPESSATALQ